MHLAGIVPIAGAQFDFGFEWHDSLMPIEKNYTAIERAVYECAMAGCHTIWIIANNDMQPLIKNRIGEWIQDPVWYGRSYDRFPSESRKEIPFYYVPVHPKDRDRRDSLGWSILYGAYVSYTTSYTLSSWLVPHKYYCVFPYGVYDPNEIRDAMSDVFNHPMLLNINTHRKFWHSGAGVDDENTFDRYASEMNVLGKDARVVDKEVHEEVLRVWQTQLEKQ